VVDETSGCIEGWPKCGLERNHFRMNKFHSPFDGDFILVRDDIGAMYERALAVVEDCTMNPNGSSVVSSLPYHDSWAP